MNQDVLREMSRLNSKPSLSSMNRGARRSVDSKQRFSPSHMRRVVPNPPRREFACIRTGVLPRPACYSRTHGGDPPTNPFWWLDQPHGTVRQNLYFTKVSTEIRADFCILLNMASAMRRFLLVCPHSHVDFRLAELTSVISMLKIGDDLKFRCGGARAPAPPLSPGCPIRLVYATGPLTKALCLSPRLAVLAAEHPTLRPHSCRLRVRQSRLPPWYVAVAHAHMLHCPAPCIPPCIPHCSDTCSAHMFPLSLNQGLPLPRSVLPQLSRTVCVKFCIEIWGVGPNLPAHSLG